MSKLTFKDILDSAIAELYGENAVELLKLFTTLNLKGQSHLMACTETCSNTAKYSKTINLGEQSARSQKGV